MASVEQLPSGRWRIRVYGGRDPLTRRKRWDSKTIDAAGKREAQLEANRWELELRDGQTTGRAGSFGQLLEEWHRHRSALNRNAPSTVRTDRTIIDTYLRRGLGDIPVADIRTHTLDVFYAELAARGGRCQRDPRCDQSPCRHGRPLAPGSVRRIHNVVRAALGQAVRWGWIRRNPAELADPGEVLDREIEVAGDVDVIRLLAEADDMDHRLAVYLALAIESGARRGAMHALRWSYFDPQPDGTSTIRFPTVISIGPAGMVERPATRTKRSGRRVTLGPHVTALLVAHHDDMFERALAAGGALPADALLFTNDITGRWPPWRPEYTSGRFRRLRRTLSLDDEAQLRHLRNLMATKLLSARVNPKVIAGRGGWRRIATMLDRYADFVPADDAAAAGIVDRILERRPADG
jgi:integrase